MAASMSAAVPSAARPISSSVAGFENFEGSAGSGNQFSVDEKCRTVCGSKRHSANPLFLDMCLDSSSHLWLRQWFLGHKRFREPSGLERVSDLLRRKAPSCPVRRRYGSPHIHNHVFTSTGERSK